MVHFVGVGRADGTVERLCYGQQISTDPQGGSWAHVTMSPGGNWITTGGHWGRSFIWIARWGEDELRPRLVAAHQHSRSSPRFCLDSRSIVFVGRRGSETNHIYLADLSDWL